MTPRDRLLQRLTASPVVDLAVIGGGATGLGVALDAALRGFSVVVLESHDFASGTSSRSTKLLHGGVRYLAQGDIPLVREALAERTTVLRLAPHLAQPLPFVMPSTRWWQTPFYGLGLKLYDLLAGAAGLGRTRWLGRAKTLKALPGVRPEDLRGGVLYWDAQFDDARLALVLARSVERAGGLPINRVRVVGLDRAADLQADDDVRSGDARSARVAAAPAFVLTLRDTLADAALPSLRARAVVNAAGVWVDEVRALGPASRAAPPHRLVSPSQGVHLVVDRAFMPGEHALLVPRTQDGRVLFAVPWMGSLVLGTTDTARGDLPREPAPFEHEVDFILREAGRVLAKAPRRDDVRSVWVGLRPLVAAAPAAGSAGSAGRVASAGSAAATPATQRLSREHTIVTDADGLVTVTGGKWTTYRAMAEDVMEALAVAGLLPRRPAGATRTHTLVGAGQSPSRSQNEARALGQGKGRGAPTAVPLTAAPGLHLYGTEADTVRTLPGVDRALGHGLTEAMVRFAARQEYALTVEDVLARRWRILFLDARAAAAMAAQVAQILREETGLDPGLEAFEGLAAQYRLDPARSTAAG